MIEYSAKQEEIINATEEKVVVVACASSGKTATMIGRVQHLLDMGVSPTEIVVITFTNMAASEIQSRLDRPPGLFTGTIHAYASSLLTKGGFQREVNKILKEEQFNKLFELVDEHPEVVAPVTYLLLDEAQDTSRKQYDFIFNHVQPKNWMIFGDYRQSLYSWNGADPHLMIDLSKERGVTTYDLDENYRNSKKVLQYAKRIIAPLGMDYSDLSIAMREEWGKVDSIDLDYNELLRLILKENELHHREWRDWFICCRTNAQVNEMLKFLNSHSIPCENFHPTDLTLDALSALRRNNTLKVITIHSSKGLESPCVAVIGARFYNEEERCTGYVAATRARDYLIWCKGKKKKKKVIMWG